MQVLKIILIIIDVIVALFLVGITLMQHKDDPGLSSTLTGAAASNFYDKNKGRTKEGKLKRWTITLGVIFAIVTIVLRIIYAI